MSEKKKAAVVIPFYTTKINEKERIALEQVSKVLNQYDRFFVAPENLKIMDVGKMKGVERFPDSCFEGVDAYNRLMLSPDFYERFQQYDYILLYQLDAFVFSDKLTYFCDLDYDYIGAPWLEGMYYFVEESRCIWNVGNGGFSLRRVKSCIDLLRKRQPLQWREIPNEDLFFAASHGEGFNVASVDVAIQFAFERQVRECYERNGFQLPFGTHAWDKYRYEFWKPYIEKEGFSLENIKDGNNADLILKKEYEWAFCFSSMWQNKEVCRLVKKKLSKMITNQNHEFIVFGAGYFGRELARWLMCNSLPFKGYCDNNAILWGEMIDDFEVFSPESVGKACGRNKIIISVTKHIGDIECQLDSMGFHRFEDYITIDDLVNMVRN